MKASIHSFQSFFRLRIRQIVFRAQDGHAHHRRTGLVRFHPWFDVFEHFKQQAVRRLVQICRRGMRRFRDQRAEFELAADFQKFFRAFPGTFALCI
jgi:hypothetical protein